MSVSPFRRYQLECIPEALRMLAHQIEADPEMAVRVLVILESNVTGVSSKAFGPEPFTRAYAVGLAQMASWELISPEDSA